MYISTDGQPGSWPVALDRNTYFKYCRNRQYIGAVQMNVHELSPASSVVCVGVPGCFFFSAAPRLKRP